MSVEKRHESQHQTPAGTSVINELFDPAEAAELEIRAALLRGLQDWLSSTELTQTAVAKQLGITQARVSDIKNGKINLFSLDRLIKLAARAGLKPRVELAAA